MARTKYYHVDEVAELLNKTSDEIRFMLKNKDLKGHKLGRRWLIDMNQPLLNEILKKSENKEEKAIYRYIIDSEHELFFREQLFSVKKSLYIATCDFKKVYFEGEELATILNRMANNGIKVVVKCMNPHGHNKVKQDFELIICDKCHMKLFIFDEETLYIGSANLTSAAIGRNTESRRAYNHEAGILTTDFTLIKQALNHFNLVAEQQECKTCKKKGCKQYCP